MSDKKPGITITIEVEEGMTSATVKDSLGNEKKVTGLAMFGRSPDGELYTLAVGSPDDAAGAVGAGLAEATFQHNPWMTCFYEHLLREMMIRTGVRPEGFYSDPKEINDRWEREDAEKAAKRAKELDPKKFH